MMMLKRMRETYQCNRNRVREWINLTICLLVFGVSAGPAYGLILPIKLGNFDTAGFGADQPDDIVFNTDTPPYAIFRVPG